MVKMSSSLEVLCYSLLICRLNSDGDHSTELVQSMLLFVVPVPIE